MNTKLLLAAIAMSVNCTIASAQVLGGSVAGDMAGSLHGSLGGMRDIGMTAQGGARGALATDIDGSGLRRSTGEVTSRASARTRSRLDATREVGRGTVNSAHHVGASAAQSTRTQAEVAASTAADLSQSAVAGANEHANEAQRSASGAAHVASSAASVVETAKIPQAPANGEPGAQLATDVTGSFDQEASQKLQHADMKPLTASADTSASGSASTSQRGVSAKGSANGAANAGFGE
jgi:hypothetical protein